MLTIIIEIPNQTSPTAWIANSDQDIISIADSAHGLVYELWTLEKSIDCWGEEDDFPEKLAKLLKEHDEVMEIGDSSGVEYYTLKNAVTHIEAAKEAIGHDLSYCQFLTVAEAAEFADSYCGHQDIKARIAVKKALEDV